MGANRSDVLSQLREHYASSVVEIFYKADKSINPVLAEMEASAAEDGMGRKYITPIQYGTSTAAGADFTIAQNKALGTTVGSRALYSRWETDPQEIHGFAVWERKALDAAMSKSSKDMFNVMTTEMDSAILNMRNLWAQHSTGDGWGSKGQIVAVTSTYFTVSKSHINKFQTGQDLVVCLGSSGQLAQLKNSGESVRVTGVNPNSCRVYTSIDTTSTAAGRTAWAADDYIFFAADAQDRLSGATSAQILPHGLRGWIPGPSVVDSSAWNGVTRNNQWQLAGHEFDCTGLEPEDAFIGAANHMFLYGTKVNRIYCSPFDWTALVAGKDKSKIVQIAVGKYEMGFEGFTVNCLAGSVPVIPDAYIPQGEFYPGAWDDKKCKPRLIYTGDLVNIDNRDGLDFRASPTSASYIMRLYSFGNIVTPGPGKFCRGHSLSLT